MAEERSKQPEASGAEPVPTRCLRGSAAMDVAMQFVNGAAVGAGGAIGVGAVHVVNQALHRPKPPPNPPSGVVLPPGVERD